MISSGKLSHIRAIEPKALLGDGYARIGCVDIIAVRTVRSHMDDFRVTLLGKVVLPISVALVVVFGYNQQIWHCITLLIQNMLNSNKL